MSDFINTTGLDVPDFGRFPTIALMDRGFGPRQLMVYAVLVAHAKKSGAVAITQARIAEMLGFYRKGKPDNALVSSLISNPAYLTQKGGTGAGLEQLGYLTKHGQTGFNMVKAYQLVTPVVTDGRITRPDGNVVDLRVPTDRQEEDYKGRKKCEAGQDAIALVARETFTDIDGSMYLREDVLADIEQTNSGHSPEVPEAAYHHFAMTDKPKTRAKAIAQAPTPAPLPAAAPAASKPVYDSRKFDNADAPVLSDLDAEKRSGYTREEVIADNFFFHDGLEREIPASVYKQYGIRRSPIRMDC